jgi:hypothetical protein
VFADVIVKEEILHLVPLKETARCNYVRNALDAVLINACVLLNKMIGVAIALAPLKLGIIAGSVGHLNNH